MNILVTGAKGQLGSCISDEKHTEKDNYFFTDVDTLDICDKEATDRYLNDNKIDVIVNCAAYTDVEKAEEESEYEKVYRINSEAVENLALLAAEKNIVLIHISTDYVFGGNSNNTPCSETQPENPTGVYGQSKLEGEKKIKTSGARAIILRTAWLYSEYGKNFLKTMLSLMSSREELNVVFDQCGTPTYARDLAHAIIEIIDNRQFDGNEGVYHFSNEGVCSWYDFAEIIREYSGIKRCEIKPCYSSDFPSKVKRPNYSVLDKTKFKKVFGYTIPYWTFSVKECMNNLKKQSEKK